MKHTLGLVLASAAALLAVSSQSAAQVAPAPTPTRPAVAGDRLGKLQQAVAHSGRTAANVARDKYRHPAETLDFFEVDPGDTVVEIWPSGGWYTEILAPYLAGGGGKLYAAAPDWGRSGIDKLKAANPTLYGPAAVVDFPAFTAEAARVPDGTADVVLTFRNVHNWKMGYRREDKQDYSAEAFRQIFAMLKPGGIPRDRRPSTAGDCRRRAGAEQRLHQDVDRASARRSGRVPTRRFVGDQRQSAGHRGLGQWRLDPAAFAGAEGPGPRTLCRDRGKRPHDPEVREARRPSRRRRPVARTSGAGR